MQGLKYFVLFLLPIGLLLSCQNREESDIHKTDDTLLVVSSFSIISDIAKEIGGNKVRVYNLVPLGMAPHTYSPTPKDVKMTSHADLIIYNGLNLEGGRDGWLFKLFNAISFDTNRVFEACEHISKMYLHDENHNSEVNPHAFINPKSGIQMAENIGKALIATDPKDSTFYAENTDIYMNKLIEIEKKYRDKLSSIPKKNRVFVSSEQAFQYLCREYDLKEGYIWAIDTDKNGTPRQMINVIDFINKYQPRSLFIESNVDRRPMEAISQATGIPIYKYPVYSDELGKSSQEAGSYLKYLEYNLQQIYDGLSNTNSKY